MFHKGSRLVCSDGEKVTEVTRLTKDGCMPRIRSWLVHDNDDQGIGSIPNPNCLYTTDGVIECE